MMSGIRLSLLTMDLRLELRLSCRKGVASVMAVQAHSDSLDCNE